MPNNHPLAILKLSTLQWHRTRADLIYLFKILDGFVDKDLQQFFVQSSNVSVCDMQLRGNVFKLFVPKSRTDMLKFSFVYRAFKYNWNALPTVVCDTKSLSIFKSRLTDYLLYTNV